MSSTTPTYQIYLVKNQLPLSVIATQVVFGSESFHESIQAFYGIHTKGIAAGTKAQERLRSSFADDVSKRTRKYSLDSPNCL
jgi:hypothetical protein